MTDISTLIGRLLPFAVIAGLALTFYLLDVFSVGQGFDSEPGKVAARQTNVIDADTKDATPARRPDPPRAPNISPPPSVASDRPSPPQQGPASVESGNSFEAESEFPPQGDASDPLPPPAAVMGQQDELNAAAPQYVPPAGMPGEPLASEMEPTAPIQLLTDEASQDEGERIENETLQAVDEDEQAASQAGAVEQEQ